MNVKYCPSCETEYFAHVDVCADCGARLVSSEEILSRKSGPSIVADADDDMVIIREGEKGWMNELADVLLETGIYCRVDSVHDCRTGRCGSNWALVVKRSEAPSAIAVVEDYYREIYPEIAMSQRRLDEGACPACGAKTAGEAKVCPECGLVLIIEEE